MNIELYAGPDADNLAYMCGQLAGILHRDTQPPVPLPNKVLAGLQFMLLRLRAEGFSNEQLLLITGSFLTQPEPPFLLPSRL